MKKILLILTLTAIQIFANDEVSESELVKVEVPRYNQINFGTINYLIFKFNIAEHWHIYWLNPGDSGIPTEIKIDAPDELKIGDILWPVPEKIPFDDLANYGYSDEVSLFVPVYINDSADVLKNKDNKFKTYKNIPVEISWLVCKEKCIPQDTSFTIDIEIQDKNEKLFDLSNYKFEEISGKANVSNQSEKVELTLPKLEADFEFFPYEGGYFKTKDQKQENTKDETILYIEFEQYRIGDPKKIQGLLVSDDKVYKIDVNISYEQVIEFEGKN